MIDQKVGSKFLAAHGELWAIASALTYALGNVMTRVVSVGGDPIAGTIIRTLPVTLLSLVLMGVRRKEAVKLLPKMESFLGWRALGLLFIYSLIVTPVSMLALYLAFRYGGVLVAVPVFAVNPLWGAMIAVPFLGEAFNKRIAGGIVATMIGIALITYGQHVGDPVSSQWPLGVVFALLTALSWALGANFRRYLFKEGMDIFWVVGITTGTGILLLTSILTGQGNLGSLTEFTSIELGQLILAGTLSAIGNLTLSVAFLSITVASATTLKNIDVVIASIIAIIFLGEVLNVPVGLGVFLIIAGVIVVQMGKDRSLEVAV
jgi:drug/metabolite transporter (DMT)-like permease